MPVSVHCRLRLLIFDWFSGCWLRLIWFLRTTFNRAYFASCGLRKSWKKRHGKHPRWEMASSRTGCCPCQSTLSHAERGSRTWDWAGREGRDRKGVINAAGWLRATRRLWLVCLPTFTSLPAGSTNQNELPCRGGTGCPAHPESKACLGLEGLCLLGTHRTVPAWQNA